MSEESASLTLRVIVDGAMGVATTTAFDDDEIARTADVAREAARHSNPVQGFRGLYRDERAGRRHVDTFDEATAAISRAATRRTALRDDVRRAVRRPRRAVRRRVRHRRRRRWRAATRTASAATRG